MIQKLIDGLDKKDWQKALTGLLIVTLMVPLALVTPISQAQIAQMEGSDQVLTMRNTNASSVTTDPWWDLTPYLEALGISVNWD